MKQAVRTMRIIFAVFMLPCVVAMSAPIWFERIQGAGSWTASELAALTLDLYQGLKGHVPPAKLAQKAPDDRSPRIVFLSIGEEYWPCRTYMGTGESLREALENAMLFMEHAEAQRVEELHKQVKSMKENAAENHTAVSSDWLDRDAHPDAWSWLKLEVVQCAKTSGGYSLETMKMAMNSMAGLAFNSAAGVAFTSSQLTGRCLLTAERFVDREQVGNFFAETLNFLALKNWMELCAKTVPLTVSLFESDSYFTDGHAVVPLYRGHPYSTVPAGTDCLAEAEHCAQAMRAVLEPKKGTIVQPFPDWFTDNNRHVEDMGSQSELVLAFCRLAAETGKKEYVQAARLAFSPVAASGFHYGPERKWLCVVEDENMPEGSLALPRKIAYLRTNALAVLAFDELMDAYGAEAPAVWKQNMRLLAEHLVRQSSSSVGGFCPAVVLPSSQVFLQGVTEESVLLEAEALATLAIHRASRRFEIMEWSDMADRNLDHLVKRLQESDIAFYPLSPWLAEALSCHYRNSGDYLREVERMAGYADACRDGQPFLADQFGMVKEWPSMTGAAEYSWILSVWAARFAENGNKERASWLLKSALRYMVFQRQGQMDFPTATALARPVFYLGFFRDHLDDYSFDLNGQVTQMLSLIRFHRLLKEHFDGKVPAEMAADIQRELEQTRQLLDRHPSVLMTNLLMTDELAKGQRRSLEGVFSKPTVRQLNGGGEKSARQKPRRSSSSRRRK